MKKIYFLFVLFISACVAAFFLRSGGKSSSPSLNKVLQDFQDATSLKKNKALKSIAYQNHFYDYQKKASSQIDRLSKDLPALNEVINNKSVGRSYFPWTAFIGISPNVTDQFDEKVNLLKPEMYIDNEANAILKKEMEKLTKAFTTCKEDYEELESYIKNEDFLDDDWATGPAYIKSLEQNITVYYDGINAAYQLLKPIVDSAENIVLRSHPLKKEILLAKKARIEIEKLTNLSIPNESTDIANIETSYKALQRCFDEYETLDLSTLKKYHKLPIFQHYFKEINLFIGQLRKAKRDLNVSPKEHDDLKASYKNRITPAYNSFVR